MAGAGLAGPWVIWRVALHDLTARACPDWWSAPLDRLMQAHVLIDRYERQQRVQQIAARAGGS